MDIGEVKGLEKFAVGPVARMRDQVHLGKSRGRDIPMLGANGDVMFEQGPGFGAAVEAAPHLALTRLEMAVDGAGADRPELAVHCGGNGVAAARPG